MLHTAPYLIDLSNIDYWAFVCIQFYCERANLEHGKTSAPSRLGWQTAHRQNASEPRVILVVDRDMAVNAGSKQHMMGR